MSTQSARRTDRIQLSLPGPRSVVFERSGAQLSSDAGLLLVRQFDERHRWTRRFAECFADDRRLPRHSLESMARQRIYGIIAGYEDCNDHDSLRDDPVFKMIADRTPTGPALASQPTLSRFENAVSCASLERMIDLSVELGVQRLKSKHTRRVPGIVVLDADPTDDPTHGQQQLSFFHGFYDQHQLYPMMISEPSTKHLFVAWLRHGTIGAGLGLEDDLERIVVALRRSNPETRVHVRADAGVGGPALYEWCDRGGHLFSCGMGPNAKLKEWGAPLLERAQRAYARTGVKQRLFAVRRYLAQSWTRRYWVVAKAECGIEGTNLRFMVTSATIRNTVEAEAAYDFYAQRGASEHRFDELKNGLAGDRLSCHRFKANFLRLQLHAMALNMLTALRDDPRVPKELRAAQPQTWRMRLVKVAARVIETTRRICIEIASNWPHWDLLRRVAHRVNPRACASGP